jgi:hypothetical protein
MNLRGTDVEQARTHSIGEGAEDWEGRRRRRRPGAAAAGAVSFFEGQEWRGA